jgi:hypothetical protein
MKENPLKQGLLTENSVGSHPKANGAYAWRHPDGAKAKDERTPFVAVLDIRWSSQPFSKAEPQGVNV